MEQYDIITISPSINDYYLFFLHNGRNITNIGNSFSSPVIFVTTVFPFSSVTLIQLTETSPQTQPVYNILILLSFFFLYLFCFNINFIIIFKIYNNSIFFHSGHPLLIVEGVSGKIVQFMSYVIVDIPCSS